jgi:transposase-like protein
MDFPIDHLMDEEACYNFLVSTLHPEGLRCVHCGRQDGLRVHHRHRAPILDYRCKHCKAVFNIFTGTVFQKTHRKSSQIVLVLKGFSQGVPTAQLARELCCGRKQLLELRHRLQAASAAAAARQPAVSGPVAEADEMFQNAGEKRRPA